MWKSSSSHDCMDLQKVMVVWPSASVRDRMVQLSFLSTRVIQFFVIWWSWRRDNTDWCYHEYLWSLLEFCVNTLQCCGDLFSKTWGGATHSHEPLNSNLIFQRFWRCWEPIHLQLQTTRRLIPLYCYSSLDLQYNYCYSYNGVIHFPIGIDQLDWPMRGGGIEQNRNWHKTHTSTK